MGFLDFLGANKKGASSNFDAPELKAQAYDTTAIALPPIRGTLPVTGNGPNTLPDLKRAARKRSEAQLAAHRASQAATGPKQAPVSPSAPAPLVPRLRTRSKSVGRPNTAPSVPDEPLPFQRPKSAGRNAAATATATTTATVTANRSSSAHARQSNRAPKFVVRKTTPGPPYLLGLSGPGAEDDGRGHDSAVDQDVPPPVPPIAAHYKSPLSSPSLTPKAPASSNGSVFSGKSGGPSGHVDILDAQGKFRPSDFKSRLQAAGARDYGEDVAERNLGVNGVNLESPAVLAFYALTGGGPLAYKSDGSAVDVHGNKYAAGRIPDLETQVQGKGKDELSDLANRHIRAPKFPTRTTSLLPSKPSDPGSAAGDLALHGLQKSGKDNAPTIAQRRMSVHGGPINSSSMKLRPLSMHPIVSNYAVNNSATPPAIPRSRPTTADPSSRPNIWRDSTQAHKLKKTTKTHKEEHHRSRSSKDTFTLDTFSYGPVAAEPGQHYIRIEDDDTGRRHRSASSVSKKSRKSKRPSDDYSSFDFGTASNGDPVMSRPSSRPSSHTGPAVEPQTEARPLSERSWKASQLNQTESSAGENRTSRRSRSGSTGSNRNRSVGGSSLRGRTQLDDISEHLPKRRYSGRRNESHSSAAPSTTITVSSPMSSIASPHSRHTNDTSLDMGYSLPKEQSQAYVDSRKQNVKKGHVHGVSSSTTASSVRMPVGYQTQRAQAPSPFNYSRPYDAESYASSTTDGSDTDLPLERRRSPNTPESESLLFKDDGYPGTGLPGLSNDPEYDSSRPVWASARPKQQTSRQRPPTSAPRLPESNTRPSARHTAQAPFPVWEDDDDSSSLTVSESDNDLYHSKRSTNASSNTGILSNLYDPVEEEMDEKLDVKLAVRLRKEMKRRERTSTRRKTLDARAAYEQGHVADTESLKSP